MTGMTRAELQQLVAAEVTTDVETAGRAYGIGRRKAYELAAAGDFPVEVRRIGARYRVLTALLDADLLPHDEDEPSTKDSSSTTSTLGQENGSQDHANPLHAA